MSAIYPAAFARFGAGGGYMAVVAVAILAWEQ